MTEHAYTRREVDEWIGATPNTAVPDRVKLRVFERNRGRCYLSGRKILPADKWDVEHVIAIVNGGENRESNLKPALKEPHKVKTAADRGTAAKIDRVKRKHLGIWPPSRTPIRSRGFPKDNRKARGSAEGVAPQVEREGSRAESKPIGEKT